VSKIREEHVMRNHNSLLAGAAALVLLLGAASAAAQPGQTNVDERARAEAERRAGELAKERAEAERFAAERGREAERLAEERERDGERLATESELESELREAREEMQEAAREVARLSSELAAPFVDGIARGYRFAGQRAMLGIGIEDTERGVRVASVSPNGPAAEAGLEIGDTITAIDGAELADARVAGGGRQSPSEVFLRQMTNVDAGDGVELRVLSENGKERDVTVTVREISPRIFGDVPKGPQRGYSYSYRGPGSWLFRSNPWSELQLITLTPALGKYFGTDKGLLIVRGPESGVLGLRDGDVILDIGGREPTTPEHAMRILGSFEAGEPLKITIMREQRRQTLDVQIPAASTG
jgi:C-terminal processing protease CtpA/Prc